MTKANQHVKSGVRKIWSKGEIVPLVQLDVQMSHHFDGFTSHKMAKAPFPNLSTPYETFKPNFLFLSFFKELLHGWILNCPNFSGSCQRPKIRKTTKNSHIPDGQKITANVSAVRCTASVNTWKHTMKEKPKMNLKFVWHQKKVVAVHRCVCSSTLNVRGKEGLGPLNFK